MAMNNNLIFHFMGYTTQTIRAIQFKKYINRYTNKYINKYIKNIYTSFFSVVVSLTLLLFPMMSHAANKLDEIAAVVNDDVVMLSEVRDRARQLKFQPKYSRLPQQALLKKALDTLILDTLQTQRAQRMGIVINDEALDNAMQRIAKQNNMTPQQFSVAVKREGLNYENYRENIRQRIIITQLQKSYRQSNATTERLALNDMINNQSDRLSKDISYKFQHLRFPQQQYSRLAEVKALKQRAENVRQRIVNGANLLAFPNSQAKTEWVAASSLSPSFLRVLNTLQTNQLSPVFHNSQGFHLLKLIDKRGDQQTALDEYKVRHILITPTPQNDQAARKKIANIRQQILDGENFTRLAQQNSDDKGSAQKGGDLGWSEADRYVPEFAAMVQRSALKTLSPPFKSQFGWHILEVIDKRKSNKTASNIRRQAIKLLDENQTENAYAAWVQQLRDTAYVDYKIDF